MKGLVSIIIPAFNAEQWIKATIESALAQTYPHCEIIVIDDGSQDRSLALARTFESRGVRAIAQSNAGAAVARNHGMRVARGDFFQFLDADDLLSPEKISAQMALLEKHPAGTLAICRWGRFYDNPAHTVFSDDDIARNFAPLEWMRLHCGSGRMMHPSAWLVSRTLAEAAGEWNEQLSLNDDGEYFARVVLASDHIVCADFPAAQTYYRSGLQHSLSRSRGPKAVASLHLSVCLVASAVSLADDAPSTRKALADYWQRLYLELTLDAPGLAKEAASRARALGGSDLRAGGGFMFRSLSNLIGLRSTLKLRRFLNGR
ncbi:MAG TPA: glycosyltransferase family A protein [Rariglobus sp.]|jgi:glycosyltransferase involved in cell wall biosynthesis|nr:glycosyltransferase family A protein [Rariglobus sp.]